MVVALLGAACGGGGDSSQGASSGEGSADDGVGSELIRATLGAANPMMTQGLLPSPEYTETLKECMRAQGFEYQEPPPPEFLIPLSDLTGLFEEVAELDPTSSLYRNRYGYGVSTVDAYLWSASYSGEDPNWEMLQTMSTSERMAWETALYGPALAKFSDPEYQPTEEDLAGDFEIGGCTKEAEDAVGIDWELQEEDFAVHMETWQRIEASTGFVDLERDWAGCAAEQGFEELTSFSDVHNLLYDKLSEIQAPSPFDDMTEEDFANLSDEEWEELIESDMGPPFTLEDLATVQEEELDIAARLADCDRAYWTGFAELEDRLRPATAEG